MTVHRLEIPHWHPTRLNDLVNCHWSKRAKLKKSDREWVGAYALLKRIPPAKGKRRISLVLTLDPGQRAGDPDAFWKSLLDALVHCKLLVDDNRQGVELGTVKFKRGQAQETEITLEDLE